MRSAHIAAELARRLPTVPTIVWRYWQDLEQWAAWIGHHHIEVVAVDIGLNHGRLTWDWTRDGIRYLAQCLGQAHHPVRLLVSGASSPTRIEQMAEAWPGPITFASQRPWLAAVHGHTLLRDLSEEPAACSTTTVELLTENAATFRAVVRVYTTQGAGAAEYEPLPAG